MQQISIGFSNALRLSGDKLQHGLRDLNEEGIKIAVNSSDFGSVTFYNLNIEDRPTFKNIKRVRGYIADAISDIIVNQIDKRIIRKLIDKYYYYFNLKEKEEIQKIAYGILDDDVNRDTFKLIKKEQIYLLVDDFLQENDKIDIEGFVNFRLRDFIGELSEITDRAVDEFMMRKEYNEFIGLLRYFVELQDSKISVLNIVINESGKFTLYDGDNRPVNGEFINDISIEIEGSDINDEDILISTLITIAPKEIYIHAVNNLKNKEILETIKKVFYEKVKICYGCELCLNPKYNN